MPIPDFIEHFYFYFFSFFLRNFFFALFSINFFLIQTFKKKKKKKEAHNNTKHKQISSYTISLCLFSSAPSDQTNKLHINLLQSNLEIEKIKIKIKK